MHKTSESDSNPMTPTLQDLKNKTTYFFRLHWNKDAIGHDPPTWSERWNYVGSIPGHESKGCYALFSGDELIYIGLGIGHSSGIYAGSGLGARLSRTWTIDKQNPAAAEAERRYKPMEQWSNVDGIHTLAFTGNLAEWAYLAAALEFYLIKTLKPAKNRTHKTNL